jgi:hypothetical protein
MEEDDMYPLSSPILQMKAMLVKDIHPWCINVAVLPALNDGSYDRTGIFRCHAVPPRGYESMLNEGICVNE